MHGEVIRLIGATMVALLLVIGCATITNQELIFSWPGEKSAEEIISGEIGRVRGDVGYGPGLRGNAFLFRGYNGEIVTDTPHMGQVGELTVEAWVMHDYLFEGVQRYVTAVGTCEDGSEIEAVLRFSHYQFEFYVAINGETYHATADGIPLPGVFHHVVGTYEPGIIRVFCDGEVVREAKVDDTEFCFDYVALSSRDEQMHGVIDEVKIYSRALEPEDVRTAYRAVFPDREPHFMREGANHITSEPQGYLLRWDNEYPMDAAVELLRSIGRSSVTILPTVIHAAGPENEDYRQLADQESVQVLADQIISGGYAKVELRADPLIVPNPEGGQGGVYSAGIETLGSYVEANPVTTTYLMMLEIILLPAGDGYGVWAIHCYIVGANGQDAFTIALNSHWRLLNDAGLWSDDRSETARRDLVCGSVQVALDAVRSHMAYTEKEVGRTLDQDNFSGTDGLFGLRYPDTFQQTIVAGKHGRLSAILVKLHRLYDPTDVKFSLYRGTPTTTDLTPVYSEVFNTDEILGDSRTIAFEWDTTPAAFDLTPGNQFAVRIEPVREGGSVGIAGDIEGRYLDGRFIVTQDEDRFKFFDLAFRTFVVE